MTHLLQIASKLDVIYALSASWGETESSEDFEMLEKKLTALRPDELILVPLYSLLLFPSKVNTLVSDIMVYSGIVDCQHSIQNRTCSCRLILLDVWHAKLAVYPST